MGNGRLKITSEEGTKKCLLSFFHFFSKCLWHLSKYHILHKKLPQGVSADMALLNDIYIIQKIILSFNKLS